MAELIKFRCPSCAKLLGASPRKVGRVIHCPQCQSELIVPTADGSSDTTETAPDDDLTDLADLGIDLGFASALDIRPTESKPTTVVDRSPREVEALAFLGKIADEGLAEPEEPAPDLSAAAESAESEFDDDEPEPLVALPSEPLDARAPHTRVSPALIDRRRDVNIPRTALIAWALFALLALALSFIAGLLLGHYHWK